MRRSGAKRGATRSKAADLFAQAPVASFSLDREGRIRRINHAALTLLDQTESGAAGRAFETLVAGVDLQAWRAHLFQAQANDTAAEADICLLVGHRPVIVLASSSRLDGDEECTMTALVDVTDRSDTSKLLELLERAKVFTAIEVTPKRLLEQLPPIAIPLLGDLCVAELRDRAGQVLHTASAHAVPELVPALRRVAPRMIGAACVRAMIDDALHSARAQVATRGKQTKAHTAVDGRQSGELERLGLGSVIVLPLSARGVAFGVVAVGTTGQRPPLGKREMTLGLELAHWASVALDNAIAVSELRHCHAAVDSAPQVRARILLVEDNDDLRNVTAAILRKLHYDVEAVGSAAEARNRARARTFDVLVSDLRLPDGSGLDLMRELLSRHCNLKGIAVSGLAAPSDVDSALRAGFAAHLKKPVAVRDLDAALLRLV
jgi:CheY-like chemotaxis protein